MGDGLPDVCATGDDKPVRARNPNCGIWACGILLFVPLLAKAERNPLPPYLDDKSFEQIADKRGVKVFKHRYSDIIRIGAQAHFPASPKRVQRALLAYNRQVRRIPRLSEARVLSRGERDLFVYQRLNLPVISDRDFVLHVRSGVDHGQRWVAYSAVKGKGPGPRPGVVRLTHHKGSWALRPLNGGSETLVRYQLSIDLSGWLPKWLARAGAAKELPALFSAICRLSADNIRSKKCP